VSVAILVLAASPKLDLRRPFNKLAQLRQRYQPVFVHIDHHAPDDRSSYFASGS
jgi:hypothetical protein